MCVETAGVELHYGTWTKIAGEGCRGALGGWRKRCQSTRKKRGKELLETIGLRAKNFIASDSKRFDFKRSRLSTVSFFSFDESAA